MFAKKIVARKSLLGVAGAVLILASAATAEQAAAASLDQQFRAAVQHLLMNLKEGPVGQMTTAERKELVSCVNEVFAGIPQQKKRYVVEARSDLAELRRRFDEIGNENRAELKQQVTRDCA
jgi:hypothetical protein